MSCLNIGLISVLMASNKVDEFLLEAINSMLHQTYKDIEIIFVANGPDSSTVSQFLLQNIADTRLKVFQTPIGQLAFALNLGLTYCIGEYIARMDCDDVSLSDRLEKQVMYMSQYNLDFVGCDLVLIDQFGNPTGNLIKPKGRAISSVIPFKCPFAHNTVLAKKYILIDARGYNSGFNSEDYDFWLRLNRTKIRWDNMKDRLVLYRIHSGASKGNKLGYAEAFGLSAREFGLNMNIVNLLSVAYHFSKLLIMPNKR